MKTIAIIHTTPTTISSLGILIKNTKIINYLDDSILPEINTNGYITSAVRARFYLLVQAACIAKPDAILCACSSIGGLLEEARDIIPIPAFRIDDAMAEVAVNTSNNITVMATLNSTLQPTIELLRKKSKTINITPILIKEAGALLLEKRLDEYEQLIADEITKAAKETDTIVLAQASMAVAAERVQVNCNILSSPKLGIKSVLEALNDC